MRKLSFALALAVALGLTGAAQAQSYPSRPITIIVPFSAGGPTDALARSLAERMRVSLGQSILIENVTGAGGSIGVGRAVRSPPDGYTLSLGHTGTHVVNGAIYPLQYDLLNDFEPIALLASNPMMIVTKNAVPPKDLRELIEWLKANPGKVAAGTAGVGSASHFAGVYFQNLTKVQLNFVPYRGTGPALQDLVAGQIDMIVDQASNSLSQVQAGKIKAYGISAEKRLAAAPDIPTTDEAGLAGFHVSLWSALWAPKGTPMDVIARLNAAVVEALADPTVRRRLADVGLEIPPREQQTPQALGAYQKAEIEKWWPIIKAAGIKAE
ncbi:MAG: putative tricarboxylic transport rane protein [Hyphomicrobiales bacterium]|jgi:tripartite-type tricarboxylate transporter receptor subunit TctC|nr:putative tricarboxylic transport rane protein [Hyphomicrobiales bacterium]